MQLFNLNSCYSCIPWKVQLFLRCQVVIGILEESKTTEKFNNCLKIKRSTKDMDEKNQSAGALIGRTYLKECLTWREYREEVNLFFYMYVTLFSFISSLNTPRSIP